MGVLNKAKKQRKKIKIEKKQAKGRTLN